MITKDNKSTDEHTKLVQDAKTAKRVAKYSVDYDKTIVIRWIFTLFCMMMGGLISLEFWHRFIAKTDGQGYLTPEIIHTIFGFIGGWASAVVTNFFAEQLAKKIGPNGNNKIAENQGGV